MARNVRSHSDRAIGSAYVRHPRRSLADGRPDGDAAGMAPEAAYTHGHHDSVLRSHRWRTAENSAGHLLAHLRPGLAVLDVGCGPGTITVDLAARVAPGPTIGIDAAPAVVEQARAL